MVKTCIYCHIGKMKTLGSVGIVGQLRSKCNNPRCGRTVWHQVPVVSYVKAVKNSYMLFGY